MADVTPIGQRMRKVSSEPLSKADRIELLIKALGPLEQEVLRLFLAGLSLEAMADEMGVSVWTVRKLLGWVRVKYGEHGLVLERKVMRYAPRVKVRGVSLGKEGA